MAYVAVTMAIDDEKNSPPAIKAMRYLKNDTDGVKIMAYASGEEGRDKAFEGIPGLEMLDPSIKEDAAEAAGSVLCGKAWLGLGVNSCWMRSCSSRGFRLVKIAFRSLTEEGFGSFGAVFSLIGVERVCSLGLGELNGYVGCCDVVMISNLARRSWRSLLELLRSNAQITFQEDPEERRS